MIYIYYTSLDEYQISNIDMWSKQLIPKKILSDYEKIIVPEKKAIKKLGKLLLCYVLNLFGYNSNCLNYLKYNRYNRPYIDENIDFNLSHSYKTVCLALSKNSKVGIDIELIRNINIFDFRSCLLDNEITNIKKDKSNKLFFKTWVIKESILKAIGTGITEDIKNLDSTKINSLNNTIFFNNELFFLKIIDLSPNIICITSKKNINIKEFRHIKITL